MEGVFKEIGKKSVVEQIVDNIVNAIINGSIKPGDKIPTEAELCASMKVGRNSVREAIKILVAYGVLEIRRAEGTFVTKGYNVKMLYPMLYGVILRENAAMEVIELRRIVDDGALHLVMEKMQDSSELDTARESLLRLREKIAEHGPVAEEIFQADNEFHNALLKITKNELLYGIGSYVNLITKHTRLVAIKKFIDDDNIEGFFALHEEVLDILAKRAADKIDAVIRDHYVYWSTVK